MLNRRDMYLIAFAQLEDACRECPLSAKGSLSVTDDRAGAKVICCSKEIAG